MFSSPSFYRWENHTWRNLYSFGATDICLNSNVSEIKGKHVFMKIFAISDLTIWGETETQMNNFHIIWCEDRMCRSCNKRRKITSFSPTHSLRERPGKVGAKGRNMSIKLELEWVVGSQIGKLESEFGFVGLSNSCFSLFCDMVGFQWIFTEWQKKWRNKWIHYASSYGENGWNISPNSNFGFQTPTFWPAYLTS